jgi:DNA-binding HxlR family transcriptional regulator
MTIAVKLPGMKPLAINASYRYRIMEALASETFSAKRYIEIWDAVKDEIRSERTLWLYLKDLERHGLIARQRVSHRKVLYQIPQRDRDHWAFVAEPNAFAKHLVHGRLVKRIMSYLLQSIPYKRQALDSALRYAFVSFIGQRAEVVPKRIMMVDSENRALVIERESRFYSMFL